LAQTYGVVPSLQTIWQLEWTFGKQKLLVASEEPRMWFPLETIQLAQFFDAMMNKRMNLERENPRRLAWPGDYVVLVGAVVPTPEESTVLDRTGLIFDICIVKESSLNELDHSTQTGAESGIRE
jgi:hypothetical protein